MSNKLRAFEAELRTAHLLLVDVDVLVLGDLSPLGELAGSIAAMPIGKPPLRTRDWRLVYDLLGMPLPDERISGMLGDLIDPAIEHLRTPEQNERLRKMMPMYHGGVVFAPVGVGLRDAWADAYRVISTEFPADDPKTKWIRLNDEVPLAAAIQKQKGQGVPFARLPDVFHAQWPHVWGKYAWGEPRLFHLMGLLRRPESAVSRDAIAREITDYCMRYREEHLEGDNRYKAVVKQNPETFAAFTHELEAELLRLLDTHVAPALDAASVGSYV
jgi:hypothetical protein